MDVKFSAANYQKNSAVQQPQTRAANSRVQQQPGQVAPTPNSMPQRPELAAATSSASRPLQGSIRRLNAQLELGDIPQELVDKVASYLPALDISAMSVTNKAIGLATKNRRTSLKVAHEISQEILQVSTLAELQGLLATANALPSSMRTEPLRHAMLRIQALPLQDQPQAVMALLAAVNQQSAKHRPPELPRLVNILGHLEARTAVSHGFGVAVVARAFDLTEMLSIAALEHATIFSGAPNMAGAAILAGENVQAVADRFSITTQDGICLLESRTIDSGAPNTAGAAILAGEGVRAVADRFGITSQAGISRLELRTINSDAPNTAGAAMLAGGKVQAVANRFGITSQEGISKLERRTINSDAPNTAGAAIDAGEQVQAVANRFEITTQLGISRLEYRTIQSEAPNTAGGALVDGGNVRVIARRFGITTQDGMVELELHAIASVAPNRAGGAMLAGENLQEVANRFGITTQEGLDSLVDQLMLLG